MDNITEVQAASKEFNSQWITIKSWQDKSYQTFKAVDLEKWLCGVKLNQYKYFTFRSNNPYIFFYSNNGVMLSQDKVYLTKYLPDFEKVTKEYYEGIREDDTITVYYSNAWWENTLNWDAVKAKLKKDGNK